MIVVDTSAAVAILRREPDGQAFAEAIQRADQRLISAASLVELGVVLASKNAERAEQDALSFITIADVQIAPVTRHEAQIAIQAYELFGKKRGHPAQLNFGDCFSYALAKALDAPLLYKGDDFSKTDVRSAL